MGESTPNTSSQSERELFADFVAKAAEDLRQHGIDGSSGLRALCADIKKLRLSDRDLIFIELYLTLFIEDLFYNFTGDFRYDKTWGEDVYNLRESTFLKIGHALENLVASLREKTPNENYQAHCVELACLYAKAIEDIKQISGKAT